MGLGVCEGAFSHERSRAPKAPCFGGALLHRLRKKLKFRIRASLQRCRKFFELRCPFRGCAPKSTFSAICAAAPQR